MQCPKCKFENPDGFQFCGKCGLSFGRQSDSAIPVADSERKRVTALFSDLSGYTAITARLDPEEVKEITSRIFDGIREIVNKYEGSIERFAGDGVLALFGVPRAHEDDPIRAIHAALEIHAHVDSLSPEYRTKIDSALNMHSGINTGLAITADADPDRGTHGVTGDAINVASRLSDLARAQEIIVGPETHRACKRHFAFEALKPEKVKGKSEVISVFKIIPDMAPATYARAGRQVFSRMVGRDSELTELEQLVMKAVKGEGDVVHVIGEAGIGKSRLIAELKKQAVMQEVTVLEGRAISIGKNLSFHPLIDLFKQWARIADDDTPSQAVHKLEDAIQKIDPNEIEEILPFVATLMGMKLTGGYARRIEAIKGDAKEKLILKSVGDLLIKTSSQQATVLIMEDLHWADTSSLELLRSLQLLAVKYRLLFISVFRPGYLETAKNRALFGSPVIVNLQPLEIKHSESLINNMLDIKGLPAALKHRIVSRSGGNPFFIEEVIRSLIDEGAVVIKDQGFEVTDKLEKVVIPATINDVLMARIDRLEEPTRQLVKIASIIGRSFFDRIIKTVADSIDRLDSRLTDLKEMQLIRSHMRMQELEHMFKHALVCETAYESTLIQQRKALHLKVAAAIETVFKKRLSEFYGMLAFHYGKGEDLEAAEHYMNKAGEEALKASASSEALQYFQESVKFYVDRHGDNADPEKLLSFKRNLARAHLSRGNFSEALFYFEEILASKGYKFSRSNSTAIIKWLWDIIGVTLTLYAPLKSENRIPGSQEIEDLEVFYRRGLCLVHTDSKKFIFECVSGLRRMLRLDLRGSPQGLEWMVNFCAGVNVAGFPSFGAKLLKRAEAISGCKAANELGFALGRVLIGINAGSWKSIPDLDAAIVDSALRKGDLYFLTAYLLHQGCLKLELGEFDEAEQCAQKLHLITESYGYDFARVHYQFVMTNLLIRRRAYHEALSEAEKGVSIAEQADMNPPRLRSIGVKIIVDTVMGRLEAAALSVKEGESLLAELGIVGPLYRAPFVLGCHLTHLELLKEAIKNGGPTEIRKYRREAYRRGKMAVKASQRHALYRVWILKSIGDYYWLVENQKRALKWWGIAINEGKELGARLDLAHTYFTVGKRLLDPLSTYRELHGTDARGYLEKARVLFTEMGLKQDLVELDRIMNHSSSR